MHNLWWEVRFAARVLLKNRGFACVAGLTLALGIGANTAIFTLLHAVMLKPLPVANPGELYRLGDTNKCCVIGGLQGNFTIFPYPFYRLLRDQVPDFTELAAFQASVMPLSVRRSGSSDAAQPYIGEFVSGNYLPLALAGGAALSSQLYSVSQYDPLIFNAAALVLILSAVVAALVPACRAASIDPMRALRYNPSFGF